MATDDAILEEVPTRLIEPRHRRPSSLTFAFVAVICHVGITLVTNSHRAFYGRVGPKDMFDDVHIYFQYASRALAGEIPYRDFVIEYPLFAFPLFLLPRLVAPTFSLYKVMFGLEMLLFDAVAVFLVARRVEARDGLRAVPGRLAWYTLFFASLSPLLITRFDLAPMALAFASALAWSSGRGALGGALAGVGTLAKIFPGVVAVPAIARDAARVGPGRTTGVLAFTATLAVGAALWLVVAGSQVRSSFQYHLERGLEIGSVYSGVLMLVAAATHGPITTDYNHSSTEVISAASSFVAQCALPIQATAMLLVMAMAMWSRKRDPLQDATAALLAFVLFGKVLSPQYMIWMIPFIAALGGRSGQWLRGLFLLACLTTTLIFPWAFLRLMEFDGWAVGLLNYRNALLLGLWLICLLANPAGASGEKRVAHVH